MRVQRVVAIGLLVLGVGASSCGVGDCTLIGCRDTITFKLASAELAVLNEGPTEVKTCVAGDCTTATLNAPESQFAQGVQLTTAGLVVDRAVSGARANISLTLTRSGVERFRREFNEVKVDAFQPNGPLCQPSCSSVTLDATL